MRIISGQHKGRKISAPKQLPIRPTTDMAKEALFNIINNQYYLDEISVLDLFSGSGNISYEFASRGVNAITAVEIHAGCTQFISEMAEKLDMPIEVIKSDVFAYLQKTPKKFNIIFADPPYALPIVEFQQIAQMAFQKELVLEGGILVIEHEKHMDLSETPNFREARRYGSSVFSFFEK